MSGWIWDVGTLYRPVNLRFVVQTMFILCGDYPLATAIQLDCRCLWLELFEKVAMLQSPASMEKVLAHVLSLSTSSNPVFRFNLSNSV